MIGRIPAFDADVADQLRYRFVSGNNANLLLLNETNGNIKLSPSLNTNVPMRALFAVSVTDGINEATATCHLVVNLVTESMLFNSVTLRLNKISQKAFLSSLFDRFTEGLAAIIPCPKENIVIFNIQVKFDLLCDQLIQFNAFRVYYRTTLRSSLQYLTLVSLRDCQTIGTPNRFIRRNSFRKGCI